MIQSLEVQVHYQGNTLNSSMDFQTSFGDGEEKMMTFTTGTVTSNLRGKVNPSIQPSGLHKPGGLVLTLHILSFRVA